MKIIVRNTTIDVRRPLTTGHWGEKSAVYMQNLPLAFPCHRKGTVSRPVYTASLWWLTEPFQCELPVRKVMNHGLLSAPSTTWIKMPPGQKGNKCQSMGQQRTNYLLSFLTCAEIRNLGTVILIKAGILRLSMASESMKDSVHPLPQPDKWINTQPTPCGHNYASVRNPGVFLSTTFFL